MATKKQQAEDQTQQDLGEQSQDNAPADANQSSEKTYTVLDANGRRTISEADAKKLVKDGGIKGGTMFVGDAPEVE